MDQFVSTYRHDFLWPYVRSLGKKLIEPELANSGFEKKCKCIQADCIHTEQKPLDILQVPEEDQGWNRIGPMGRLLEPKLYPVKAGASPETDTMRQNQPNMFMNKLEKKYPFLYEVLKEDPAVAHEQKINKDRLQTTYQVDYCQADFIPPQLVRAGGDTGLPPCPERIPEDPYTTFQKIKARRPAVISKLGIFKKKNKKCDKEGGDIHVWTFNNTTYQDEICKVGEMIMKCNRISKKRR